MRIGLEAPHVDFRRPAAAGAVGRVHPLDQRWRPEAVVEAVEPEAGVAVAAPIVGEGLHQLVLPLRTRLHAQAAGKVDQAQHARVRAHAEGQGGQSAVRLADDNDPSAIDVRQLDRIIERHAQVARLSHAVGRNVAAVADVRAGGAGKAAAHRDQHHVAATDELPRRDRIARALLLARVARRLAVVDHDQRERPRPVGLEQRGFELGPAFRVADEEHLLVEPEVERRQRGRGHAAEHHEEQTAKQECEHPSTERAEQENLSHERPRPLIKAKKRAAGRPAARPAANDSGWSATPRRPRRRRRPAPRQRDARRAATRRAGRRRAAPG